MVGRREGDELFGNCAPIGPLRSTPNDGAETILLGSTRAAIALKSSFCVASRTLVNLHKDRPSAASTALFAT